MAEIVPSLIGEDPTTIVSLHRRTSMMLGGHGYARAAIDIATYDITVRFMAVQLRREIGPTRRWS